VLAGLYRVCWQRLLWIVIVNFQDFVLPIHLVAHGLEYFIVDKTDTS
jgi:hypothetical protein